MRAEGRQVKTAPTHVCPHCGEWWDVVRDTFDIWVVTAYANDPELKSKVWTEAARAPVCPVDTRWLKEFKIVNW